MILTTGTFELQFDSLNSILSKAELRKDYNGTVHTVCNTDTSNKFTSVLYVLKAVCGFLGIHELINPQSFKIPLQTTAFLEECVGMPIY